RAEVAHGVAAAVPAVEVPDDAHALRVRRPYGEQRAGDTVERPRVGAQEFLGPGVLPGVEVPEVLLPDRRPERPGLVAYPAHALAVLQHQAVVPRQPAEVARVLEKIGVPDAAHRARLVFQPRVAGVRQERPHGIPVTPENGERV